MSNDNHNRIYDPDHDPDTIRKRIARQKKAVARAQRNLGALPSRPTFAVEGAQDALAKAKARLQRLHDLLDASTQSQGSTR